MFIMPSGAESKPAIDRRPESEAVELSQLDLFTLPEEQIVAEEQRLLTESTFELADRYRTALVIGRFQPLHRGHLYLMRQALRLADTLVIGIGSANINDTDNPYPPEIRELLIRRALTRERDIQERVANVVYIEDDPDDDVWLTKTIERTGSIDVVVGNNDWVNRLFLHAGYPAISVPLFRRDIYEGKKIRILLREQNKL